MKNVVVYGAYGHTGRFVVDELRRRGLDPVPSGRSADGSGRVRVAAVDDPTTLRRAFAGAAVVVNCAGPFLDTALPVADAAVESGAHYVDVTAEQASVRLLHDRFAHADVAVVPAVAFYGGLPDLLATALSTGWDEIDEITVAVSLDRWWPTVGTRRTGARNTAPRLVVRDGRLAPVGSPPAVRTWPGVGEVVETPLSEIPTMASHLRAREIHTFLDARALRDLHDPTTPPPVGPSFQAFVVDVVVRRAGEERRGSIAGRDIYATSAPIVVEAVVRLLDGRVRRVGAAAPGVVFDARDVLDSLRSHVDELVLPDQP